MAFFQCASEDETCVLGGTKYVAYGANNVFNYKLVTGSVPCTDAEFGNPISGTKACYFANYYFVGNENGTAAAPRNSDVAYGANGVFNFRTISGGFNCNNGTFGDPIPGVVKACYVALPGYQFAVGDNGRFSSLANTPVAYGTHGNFFFRVLSGTPTCSISTFGGDPAPGLAKQCYSMSIGTHLATEGENYLLNGGPVSITYTDGLNGNFLTSTQPSGQCSNTFFGGDPDLGFVKSCWGQLSP
jgi:hypothetical protein